RIASAITITAGKIDVADKTGFSLTAAYDAAKIASSQSSVDAVKFSTDNLSSAMEADGAVYRFTTNALENAPAGGGGGTADWTATERNQIRHRLGIDGTATAPSTGTPSLAKPGDAMTLTSVYDAAKVAAPVGAAMTLTPGERGAIAAAEWNWTGTPVASSIGRKVSDSLPGLAPGSAGGLFIAGSNVPTNVNINGNITGNLVGNVTGSVNNVVNTDAIASAVRDVSNLAPASGSLGADVKAGIGGSTGSGWDEVLPGSHAVGTAGYIVGHNLDAQVSSRLPTTSYIVPPSAIQNATATRDIDNSSPPTGSLGDKINLGASAGDPWATVLPSASYPPGTAGGIHREKNLFKTSNQPPARQH